MPQSLIYTLLLLSLFLPVIGALALRVLGPRLTAPQFYLSAAGMFAVIALSVFMLVRSDLPSLQLGGLTVLLPVSSPGDVAVQLPDIIAPTEPPPSAPNASAPTGDATPAAAQTAAAESSAVLAGAATAAPSEEPTAQPTDAPAATSAPTEAPTATPEPTVEPTAAPEPTGPRKYTVQPGDTLRSIAEQFNVSVKAIIDANKLSAAEADSLRVGQDLIIP